MRHRADHLAWLLGIYTTWGRVRSVGSRVRLFGFGCWLNCLCSWVTLTANYFICKIGIITSYYIMSIKWDNLPEYLLFFVYPGLPDSRTWGEASILKVSQQAQPQGCQGEAGKEEKQGWSRALRGWPRPHGERDGLSVGHWCLLDGMEGHLSAGSLLTPTSLRSKFNPCWVKYPTLLTQRGEQW